MTKAPGGDKYWSRSHENRGGSDKDRARSEAHGRWRDDHRRWRTDRGSDDNRGGKHRSRRGDSHSKTKPASASTDAHVPGDRSCLQSRRQGREG
jgi:hypothetical protein